MEDKHFDEMDDFISIENNNLHNVLHNKIKIEYESVEDFIIKTEPLDFDETEISNDNQETDVKSEKESYEYEVVKEELVVGPEAIQVRRYDSSKLLSEESENNEVGNEREKRFKCRNCCEMFIDKDFLKKHKRTCFYECDYCEKYFNSRRKIEKHFKTHARASESITGDYAYKENNTNSEKSIEHRNQSSESLICKICYKEFRHKNSLGRHVNDVHVNAKTHECNYCSKSYSRNSDLKDHINTKHFETRTFLCQFCNHYFSKEGYLKRHQKLSCPKKVEVNNVKCELCKKYYSTKKTLESHQKKHCAKNFKATYKIRTSEFVCDICRKVYTYKSTLRKHIMQSHYDAPKFKCDHCAKEYVNKRSVKRHIHSKHFNYNAYACRYCKKTFCWPWSKTCHEKAKHKHKIE